MEFVKGNGVRPLRRVHLLRASEGTPAYDFEDQIDAQTAEDRYDILMAAQLEITAAKNEAKIGEELDVLCEGFDTVAECFYGRSAADAPEVDGKVYFRLPEASDRPNQGRFRACPHHRGYGLRPRRRDALSDEHRPIADRFGGLTGLSDKRSNEKGKPFSEGDCLK